MDGDRIKSCFCPETNPNDPDYLIAAILSLCTQLKIEIKSISYTGLSRDVGDDNFAAGIYIGASGDLGLKLKVSSNPDKYEDGRRFVRAQHAISIFNKKPFGPTLLKRNHLFFGNNPSETTGSGKNIQPVQSYMSLLENLFKESDWSITLRKMLVTLLRKQADLMNKEIRMHTITSNIISYEEYAQMHLSRAIVFKERRGTTTTVLKQVSKPNKSSVLTKGEYELFTDLVHPYFACPPLIHTEKWIDAIIRTGWDKLSLQLDVNHKARIELLQLYAGFTTSRLKDIRSKVSSASTKRKKDIALDELEAFCRITEYRQTFVEYWVKKNPLQGELFSLWKERKGLRKDVNLSEELMKAFHEPDTQLKEVTFSDLEVLMQKQKNVELLEFVRELADFGLNPTTMDATLFTKVSDETAKLQHLKETEKLPPHFGIDPTLYSSLPARVKKVWDDYHKHGVPTRDAVHELFEVLDSCLFYARHDNWKKAAEAWNRAKLSFNYSVAGTTKPSSKGGSSKKPSKTGGGSRQ
jgi:hypothetical protein